VRAQRFFKPPKGGKVRNFLVQIDSDKSLKAESVNELVFKLGITETEQKRLQKRSFDHP
jgi:hypothetical protein